ncbi:MAG: C40 family peptidase, partial [Lachnospiraceae bacterium]|nr:C40 family peptidase [Lachnospiraceae bacterium]
GAVATGGASEALHAAKAGFNAVKKTAQTAKRQMEGAGQPADSAESNGGAATGGTKPTEMNANSLSQGTVAAITAAVAAAANAIFMALMPLIIALLPAIVIVGCITAPLAAAMSVIDLFKADVSLKTEAFRPTIESVAEEYELQDYTEILLAIMELESGGDAVVSNNDLMGAFKGVARDAFISANGRDISTDDSIRSAAATLAQLVAYGKTLNVDRKTIIQAYNYGQAFIDYIAQNYGGCYSDEAALAFITDPATGIAATEFDTNYANKVMEKLEGTPMAPESYAAVESEMLKYEGVKYVWGGNTPEGFDCSGLIQYVYGTLGVKLPHSAQDMYYSSKPVSSSDVQPGDLVFFTGTADTGKYVTHVGIYTGPGQMYAAGGSGVGYTNIGTQYWQTHLLGYGRIAR